MAEVKLTEDDQRRQALEEWNAAYEDVRELEGRMVVEESKFKGLCGLHDTAINSMKMTRTTYIEILNKKRDALDALLLDLRPGKR